MKKTIIIILLILFPNICLANNAVVGNIYKKIDCGDGSYLEIQNDTFKSEVQISCKLSDMQYGLARVYDINIFKDSKPITTTRKEMLLYIPIKNLSSQINDYSNLSMYVFDTKINDWVIYSTELKDNYLIAKVIKTGLVAINEKVYNPQNIDIYMIISIILLVLVSLMFVVYNKTMRKLLFIITSILFIFSGCASNNAVELYNQNSRLHQEKVVEAFGNLSASLNYYNQKLFDDSMAQADLCILHYNEAKELSAAGKEIAKDIKDQGWIEVFKDISLQSEDLRTKQCELLKSASTEAKKLNPDTETITNYINQIADYNSQFNKLQTTLNDMQNQHESFFK